MPNLGLIGGTGLARWGSLEHEIAGETPFGSSSAPIAVYEVAKTCLLFLSRHGLVHSIPPHRVNYRANLWALKQAGAKQVLAINAVGGIGEAYRAGALAAPTQLIDYTWGRAQSYSDDETAALQHIEFAEPFEGPLRAAVLAAAEACGLALVDGGCVGVTQGPRLETAAEIRRLTADGCDMVGMTSMPEAALARELGLDYAAVCVVANPAAGIGDRPITMAEIEATLQAAMEKVRALITAICERL